MRFTALLVAAALALGLASARKAEACGGPIISDEAAAALLVVGGTYAGVTIGMGIKDLATDNHSMGYGIAETVIHAPIAMLWGGALMANLNDPYGDGGGRTALFVMTGLHGALAAHGVYTIVKRSRAPKREPARPAPYQGPPGMFQVGRVSASVAPTAMRDGAGFGLAGAF